MKKSTIGILGFVAVLLLAGAVSAGNGVWISDDGDSFDLSDLEDGETKIFGAGDKQITASRRGDTISIESEGDGDGRPVNIECTAGQDSCRVMTFGDDDSKVALMMGKRHAGHHVVSVDENVMIGDNGETTIMITRIGDCDDDDDAGCIGKNIEILDGSALAGEMIVEVIASAGDHDPSHNVWVSGGDSHHGRHTMMVTDGATKHDLSELYDGETRIFGYGGRQVSAVREGDKVSITRPQSDDDDDSLLTCTIGRDSCQVLTYEDDPEKVAVMIAKTAGCDADEDCADLLRLQLLGVHEGDFGGADVKTIHRIKVVTEDD
jgi:hypothetical protein